jgi:hypothetical protein
MILLAGDPHGRFDHLIDAVFDRRPSAVIMLGDIQARQPLEVELELILKETEIWFIHGNHDTDSEEDHDNLFGSALAGRNLHGRVVKIDGVRVAGLGGVFRSQVWMPPGEPAYKSEAAYLRHCGRGNRWRGGLPRKHRSTIFADTVASLARERADVLVTHEAPSCHPHGFAAIDHLGKALGVRSVWHGHHHDSLDYREHWPRIGFEAHGVGLRGLTWVDGRVLRGGEV